MFKRYRRRFAGFTLIELLMALGVAAVLAVVAVGGYQRVLDGTRAKAATGDIATLEIQILRYRGQHNRLPNDLAELGQGALLDPWDRPYHYTLLEGVKGSKGAARKDKKLNPLNSDYDLFSAGKDGVYKTQVSNKDSLDDIIRAHNGAYKGLAKDF